MNIFSAWPSDPRTTFDLLLSGNIPIAKIFHADIRFEHFIKIGSLQGDLQTKNFVHHIQTRSYSKSMPGLTVQICLFNSGKLQVAGCFIQTVQSMNWLQQCRCISFNIPSLSDKTAILF